MTRFTPTLITVGVFVALGITRIYVLGLTNFMASAELKAFTCV